METIEKLNLLKQSKRLMENVVNASFEDIGKGSKFYFYHVNLAIGSLQVAIKKLEKV